MSCDKVGISLQVHFAFMHHIDKIVHHVFYCSSPWMLVINGLTWLAVAWACDSELRVSLAISTTSGKLVFLK